MRVDFTEAVEEAKVLIEQVVDKRTDIGDILFVFVTAIALVNVTQAESITLDEKTKRTYKKLKEVTEYLEQILSEDE